MTPQRQERICFQGFSGAQGIAVGKIYVYDRIQKHFPHREIADDEKTAEITRLKGAIQKAIAELSTLRQRLLNQGIDDSGGILDAHLLMMQDPLLFEEMQKGIQSSFRTDFVNSFFLVVFLSRNDL